MTLFRRIHQPAPAEAAPPRLARTSDAAFRLEPDASDEAGAALLLKRPNTNDAWRTIWSRTLASAAERDALLEQVEKEGIDVAFWGRLALAMGTAAIDGFVDPIVKGARDRMQAEEKRRQKHARERVTVSLYRRERKGRFHLDLERESESTPDWSIRFDGRSERDRMCDWLRWQGARYLEFLDFAEQNGALALERRLVDEMLETEVRLRKEGRTVGGLRPLRMWRGE